jgi:hypothetical protein
VVATLTAPLPGAALTGSTANFTWSGGVGVVYYELLVGTASEGANIFNSGLIPPGTQSETVTLPANQPMLYASFRQFSGGVWQPWQYSTYNQSAIATLTAPLQGATLTGSTANFTWSGGVGVVYYELLVGTASEGANIFNSGLIPPGTQSETVTLPAGEPTLYASFRQFSGGVWQPWQYSTYNESAIATLTAPLQGATLTGSTANFTWSGGVGVVYYELLAGTRGQGSSNVYNPGLISPATQSETVTLPASGSTLYVSFRQLSGGVWQPWQYSTYPVQ